MIQVPEYKTQDETLKIVSGITSYLLPVPWSLEGDGEIQMRSKAESRALSHGAMEVGDYKAESRTLTLNFYFKDESRQEYDRMYDEILAILTKQDYRLYAGREDRYYKVSRLDRVKSKWVKGYKGRYAEITASLRCADPFKYSEVREFKTISVTGQENITVNNFGSADAPLIIRFIPNENMPKINFANKTTGEVFIMQDTLLTHPAAAVVNSELSTVYRDSYNSINTFNGAFINLLPGINNLSYSGNAGDIEISFCPRWY